MGGLCCTSSYQNTVKEEVKEVKTNQQPTTYKNLQKYPVPILDSSGCYQIDYNNFKFKNLNYDWMGEMVYYVHTVPKGYQEKYGRYKQKYGHLKSDIQRKFYKTLEKAGFQGLLNSLNKNTALFSKILLLKISITIKWVKWSNISQVFLQGIRKNTNHTSIMAVSI